jgi:hypothetical protein
MIWSEVLLTCVTIFSVLLQFYLAYIIRAKSPKNMESYKFFLYLTLIWDIAFTINYGLFFQPFAMALHIMAGVRGLAYYFGHLGSTISFCFIFYSAANLGLSQLFSLCYRYALLHDNPQVFRQFQTFKVHALYICISQGYSVYLSYLAYDTVSPPNVSTK